MRLFAARPTRATPHQPACTREKISETRSVSDRLNDLRRQRELIQQHLEWLDAEIALESLGEPAEVILTERPRFTAPDPSRSVPPSPDPDALLRQYSVEARNSPAKAKLGCWVAFVSAFVLFTTVVTAWYFLSTR